MVTTYTYNVQMPLNAGEFWWTIAVCQTPGAAAEVIRVLLANTNGVSIQVHPVQQGEVIQEQSPPF